MKGSKRNNKTVMHVISGQVNATVKGSVAYKKPKLTSFGDVRDITLGGSPGGGDSGTPTTRRRR